MRISEIKPLNYNELSLALQSTEFTQAEKILEWVADQDVNFIEDEFSIAGKEIFRFQGSIENGKSTFYSFGRSENRKIAAIKAAAELIERVAYSSFTKNDLGLNLKLKAQDGSWEIQESPKAHAIEKSFHNSNGWAVDFSAKNAIDRALREALERHILLLSYIKHGWNGFFQIDQTQVSHFDFKSLVAKYSVAGFSAGLSLCQSPSFPGASFGSLCDHSEKILTSKKWEQSFYEAFDYLRMRELNPDTQTQSDLISKELDFFLQNPFLADFDMDQNITEIRSSIETNLAVIDLQKSLTLPFPFFAAVVHGKDLLPLYFKPSLTQSGQSILEENLALLGIQTQLPERHPIL